jgi:hypothetical protein
MLSKEELKARVIRIIAATRFPFVDQTDWNPSYITITNDVVKRRSIEGPEGKVYPSIVIVDAKDEVKEIGEVEMEDTVTENQVEKWELISQKASTDGGVKRFFLYVPEGKGKTAQRLLRDNSIEYAGLHTWAIKHSNLVVTPIKILETGVNLDAVNLIRKKYIRTERGMKIYLIDGEYFRDNLDIDFTVGGHHWVYPFIPKNEVWLDEAYAEEPKELEYFLAHELEEIKHMKKGMKYEEAHALANALEKRIRDRIDKKMSKLQG